MPRIRPLAAIFKHRIVSGYSPVLNDPDRDQPVGRYLGKQINAFI